jgi:hypothetical protein
MKVLSTGLRLPTFKNRRLARVFPVVLTLWLVLMTRGSVLAQDSVALQISPALTEINVDPGESASLENFEIFNPSNSVEEVRLVPQDIVIVDETGTISLAEERDDRYSLAAWLKVKPETVTLRPRDHQTLEVVLAVPADAEPGGHYGALFALSKGTKPLTIPDTRLGVQAGVAAPILLRVNGPVSTTGEIVEFRQVPFLNLGPVDFLIRFKNTGTIHYQPHGFIEIFDFFGNKAATVAVDERRAFPETVRQLTARWNRLLLVGRYRAVATIFYGLEGERQDTAAIEFWAFPYKGAAAVFGILVTLVLLSRLRSWWQGRGVDL